MAKKKQRKKHNFKYSAPATTSPATATPAATTPAVDAPAVSASATKTAAVVAPGLAYVKRDLAKVGLLAGGFIALEVVLWYLFGHTNLGSAVYHLIKL